MSLILQKPDYEPHPWSFEFGEVSQVAYVQLANAPQLFDAAERELKDLTKALVHLERAQTLRYDPEVDLRVRALRREAGK